MLIAVEQWNIARGIADPTWRSGLYFGVLGFLNILSVLAALHLRWWDDLVLNSAPIAKYAIGAPMTALVAGLWLLITRTKRYKLLRSMSPRPIAKFLAAGYGVLSVAGFLSCLALF
jgi:hypothetical protein